MSIGAIILSFLYWIWLIALAITVIAVGVYVGMQTHYRKVKKIEAQERHTSLLRSEGGEN
ncbi:hypothetical protein [Shouchella lehensis]|uniref:Uncharacterized protein n=2 Tax=Shouchella lehensis TaxID=300825 RepID=A0A060LYM2_9BACI|nr:hypothetical protein [Shouchella lehensis]AIC96346.1 hypothetical protein BleG1_3799 [Shouchella lehensis G1]MBG9785222.1 hypothetical protein [Shouchella lehensis]RQW18943.1 hypothetical protein EH196_18500 [Bacillus sp. C1-1]TES46663.1 hypothetical protein E2L03_18435 [Shouchella lehensis]